MRSGVFTQKIFPKNCSGRASRPQQMKKLIVIATVVVGIFTLWFYSRHPLQTTVTIQNTTFVVDLAVTNKEKERGLGGRDSLAPNHGMLFVYDHKEPYSYWMKDMRFPIDIIWIDDKTIVDITRNVALSDKPLEQLPIYHPLAPVNKVLELNAGTVDRLGIQIGELVKITQ